MVRLHAFWKALDEIPGTATDARDWRCRLGGEFDQVRRLLRNTGTLAKEMNCPSPGGAGCPRRIVPQPDGGWRAVCGDPDIGCDPLSLTTDDINILALDRGRLVSDLASVFGLSGTTASLRRGRVVDLGRYAIAEGVGTPVFLLIPGPEQVLTIDELQAAGVPKADAILLTPRRRSLSGDMHGRLNASDHHVVHLSEAIGVGADGSLVLVQPAAVLLQPIHERLQARLGAKPTGPVVFLPPGTTWEKVTLVFKGSSDLECHAAGGTQRISPEQAGISNERNGEPTSAWNLLLIMARGNGRLRRGLDETWEGTKKQKQELSKHLQRIFGISGEPIPFSRGERAYVCRFVLRDERSFNETRREAAGRNFAN